MRHDKKLLACIMSLCCALDLPLSAQDGISRTGTQEKIDSSVISSYTFYENSISAFGSTLVRPSDMPVASNATVEQVLRLMPSVDVRERGGKSVQTDIGIRGGSADQTAILLNGIDFTDIRTGHQSHSLPVDEDIMDHIRLLDGSNQGLTGALNMVAAARSRDHLRLHLSGGDFGYRYVNLSGSHDVGRDRNLNIFGALSRKKSDGYISSTDFENTNAYVRARYDSGIFGDVDAQFGYQKRDFGANGFYSLKYPDQFESTSTVIGSVRSARVVDNWIFESYLSYRHNTDRFELIRGSEEMVPFNYHKTDNFGLYGSGAYVWSAGRTSLSGELRYGTIMSTVLGEPMAEPVPVKGSDSRLFTMSKDRMTGYLQLRHQKNWAKAGLKASLEGDFSPYGFTPLFNMGGEYRPAEEWTLSLMGARTLRLPTFTDLFYTATGYVSNPDLVPEHAVMAMASSAYARGGFSFMADLWARKGSNIIDWVKSEGSPVWESLQITEIVTVGADITASYERDHGFMRNVSASFGWITSDKESGTMVSRYAMDYMKLKASLVAGFQIGKHILIGTEASYFDRAGNYTSAAGESLPYKPYGLLSANISYCFGKSVRLYIDADNVTSTRYYDYGGLLMPSLWLMSGVVINI